MDTLDIMRTMTVLTPTVCHGRLVLYDQPGVMLLGESICRMADEDQLMNHSLGMDCAVSWWTSLAQPLWDMGGCHSQEKQDRRASRWMTRLYRGIFCGGKK